MRRRGASPAAGTRRRAAAAPLSFVVVEHDVGNAHPAGPATTHYVGGVRAWPPPRDGDHARWSRGGLRDAVARVRAALVAGFAATFLPRGYPADYLQYQSWDTLQALTSYLRGILATHTALVIAGVGDASASAIAATMSWVVRDGAAMVASLLFATWGSARFDRNCKSWRLFADVINDVGLSLEMSAQLFGRENAVLVMCIAACCKALCGTASGAVKAVITRHFAVYNNLGDVASKESSQELMVSLVGMISGLFLARFVEPGSSAPTIVFVLLTLVHVVANWLAVRGLQLRSLNTNRAEVVIDAYLDDGRVLSPAEAAAAESLWPSSGWWSLRVWAASLVRRGRPRPPRLEMGCRLTELPDASVVEAAASGTTPPPFVAAAMVVGAHSVVRIAVWQGAAPCDEFAAAFTAVCLRRELMHGEPPCRDVAQRSARLFSLLPAVGWDVLTPLPLDMDVWRYSFADAA